EDPEQFIAAALSPAKVQSVTVVDPKLRSARVVVPDYQLSLAIGKEGQNARLAAKLTGWRIDIRPDTAPETSGGVAVPGQPGGTVGWARRSRQALDWVAPIGLDSSPTCPLGVPSGPASGAEGGIADRLCCASSRSRMPVAPPPSTRIRGDVCRDVGHGSIPTPPAWTWPSGGGPSPGRSDAVSRARTPCVTRSSR